MSSDIKVNFNNTEYINNTLYPQTVILEKGSDRVVLVLKPGSSVNTRVGRYSGYTLTTQAGNFLSEKELLKQAAILDTETLGKGRGSTITELAILHSDKSGKKQLDVIVPELDFLIKTQPSLEIGARSRAGDRFVSLRSAAPELFKKNKKLRPVLDSTLDLQYLKMLTEGSVGKRIAQDFSKLKGARLGKKLAGIKDAFTRIYGRGARTEDYITIARNLQRILGGTLEGESIQEIVTSAFREEEKFQAKYYFSDLQDKSRFSPELKKAIGYLSDRNKELTDKLVASVINTQRNQSGVSADDIDIRVQTNVPKEEMFERVSRILNGKVTLIANAAFEAKQLGAQLNSIVEDGIDTILSKEKISDPKELAKRRKIVRREILLNLSKTTEKDTPLKNITRRLLEATRVSASTGEPFYVSGQDYLIQRAKAFLSGDFSGLTEAFLTKTRAGDTRDILDLVRSQQSLLGNLGLLDIDKPLAIGVEVQARLFLSAKVAAEEGAEKGREVLANYKELHRAYADVVPEEMIFRESLEQGKLLTRLAKGDIDFANADKEVLKKTLYYSQFMQEALMGRQGARSLESISFTQFAGRFLLERGETGSFSVAEPSGISFGDQAFIDDTGTLIKETNARVKYRRENFESFNDMQEQLRRVTANYKNINTEAELEGLRKTLLDADIIRQVRSGGYEFTEGEASLTKQQKIGAQLSETAAGQIELMEAISKRPDRRIHNKRVDALLAKLVQDKGGKKVRPDIKLTTSARSKTASESTAKRLGVLSSITDAILDTTPKSLSLPDSFHKATQKSLGKYFGMYAAGAGIMGGFSAIQDNFYPDRKSENLVQDYDSWFENQAEMFGNNDAFLQSIKGSTNIEGMQEGGLAAELRKRFTDFGSPYAGPEYSHEVLNQNKLYRMRQTAMSQAFFDRHFREGDIATILSRFKSSFKREMGTNISALYSDTTPIDMEKYQNLRGNNLVKLNLKEGYKISMEDADTLTIQGAGNSPLNAFMGSNKYSFRLAGIDSPETSHAGRAAQPYAEEAKRIAQAIIKRAKNVEIVVNPDEVTYGRQVAMIYADGINVNLELIKRGAAAYLPYRSKQSPNMYNEQAFAKAQEMAQQHERGMWRTAYFKGYRDIVKASGQSVTFNKLANEASVAQSSSLMSMYSLMNNAQAMGFYSNATAMEAANIGNRIGALGVRAFKPDARSAMHHENHAYTVQNNPYYQEHVDSLNAELLDNIKSRGGGTINRNAARNVSRNNALLVDNAMQQYKNIWNKEKYRMSSIMKSNERKINRMRDMEFLQQEALRDLNRSPIGHWRM